MTLDEWMDVVAHELDVAPALAAPLRTQVLDLARDAAHGVARPAAPLTTFLFGVAIGAGAEPAVALEHLARLISSLDPGGAEPDD